GDHDHREVAERALSAFAEPMRRYGAGVPLTLSALDFHLDVPREVVIVDGPGGADLARVVGESFVPNRVLMRVTEAQARAQVGLIPLLEGKVALDGVATAYVCERGRCELPTSDPNVLRRQLSAVQPLIPGGSPEPLTVRR
ncbi:MAG: hypothetical protein DRJ42_17015, partial [Deltaproteobacteria bacterium]